MVGDIVSPYLSRVLKPITFGKTIKALVKELKPFKDTYDTIVFRGSSGCMVGPALAAAVNKQMLLVRKEGDRSHSSYMLEGFYELENYIIVDDLICTGGTIKAVVDTIRTHIDRKRKKSAPLKCVGFLSYFDPNDGADYLPDSWKHHQLKKFFGHDDFFMKGIWTKIKDNEE